MRMNYVSKKNTVNSAPCSPIELRVMLTYCTISLHRSESRNNVTTTLTRAWKSGTMSLQCSDKMSIFRWQPPAPRSMLMGLKVEVLWPLRLTSNMVPLNIWAGLFSLSGCLRPHWTSMWPTPGCHKSRGGKYLSTTTFNKGNKGLPVPSSKIPLATIGESKTRQLPFTMKFQQPTPGNNASM